MARPSTWHRHTCVVCLNPFKPLSTGQKYNGQKYCSATCRKDAEAIRRLEQRERVRTAAKKPHETVPPHLRGRIADFDAVLRGPDGVDWAMWLARCWDIPVPGDDT